MDREDARSLASRYCRLRDVQYAAYTMYARRYGLTTKELLVLNAIWFSPDGCSQLEICERLSASKQTISAIIRKFLGLGYVVLEESKEDRRTKTVRFTEAGTVYASAVIPPAVEAEGAAISELGDENAIELLRLTEAFSRSMKEKFMHAAQKT